MAETRPTRGLRGSWAGLAFTASFAATAILITQGCCSVICPNHNKREVTHTVAITEGMVECPGSTATCVCPLPARVTVRGGDRIRFVNTTGFGVKIHPSNPAAFTFTPPGDIVVDAKRSQVVTVVEPIPASLGTGIGLDYFIDQPGELCSDLPGPGVDWD